LKQLEAREDQMSDFGALAREVVTAVGPFMPFLLRLGETAAEEAAKKLGGAAWEKAKSFWVPISATIESVPGAKEAAKDLATDPEDGDHQAAFRVQLKKVFSDNANLASAMAAMAESVPARVDRSISVGGDATGTFISGDNNTIRR
jgi:hypothetical protein